MMNRLSQKIRENQKKRRKLFCAFLTLGYPNLATTRKLILEFDRAGVDILELGFPFSDPLADGPTIQYSSECALKKKVRLRDAFKLVSELRKQGVRIPILFFTYLNPAYHYGLKKFASDAKRSGFDGLIVPDLPPEEEKKLQLECRAQDLAQVFLVAPTTDLPRMKMIAHHSHGFIYYVSLKGVTGARKALSTGMEVPIRQLKRISKLPVLVGFGVSTPEQARKLSKSSDGVIVGSAIVDKLRGASGKTGPAVHYIRRMVRAVRNGT